MKDEEMSVLKTSEKISNVIQRMIEPQFGHVIGCIKISMILKDSRLSTKFDSLYTDCPTNTVSHWLISDVIEFDAHEYIACQGGMYCSFIKNVNICQSIKKVLYSKLLMRNSPKTRNIFLNDNRTLKWKKKINVISTANESVVDFVTDSEDDLLDILKNLDTNGNRKRKYSEIDIDIKIENKRILPSFVNRRRVSSENDRLSKKKFSRTNSLKKMKSMNIDILMVPENNSNITSSMVSTAYVNDNVIEQERKSILRLPEKNTRIIIFDSETASFQPPGLIIDLACIELVNGQRTGRVFQGYCVPWNHKSIHAQAFKVHGLSTNFLRNHSQNRSIIDVMYDFLKFIQNECICEECAVNGANVNEHKIVKLVAHNSTFDRRHVLAAIQHCKRHIRVGSKYSDIDWNSFTDVKIFDTLQYWRTQLGNYANYSLDGMANKLGVKSQVEREVKHGALIDTHVLCECLQKLWINKIAVEKRKCKSRQFQDRL